jgi:hypothetical protein
MNVETTGRDENLRFRSRDHFGREFRRHVERLPAQEDLRTGRPPRTGFESRLHARN